LSRRVRATAVACIKIFRATPVLLQVLFIFYRMPRIQGGPVDKITASIVAIARSLAMAPRVMLFKQPTSALDSERIGEVLDVVHELAREGM